MIQPAAFLEILKKHGVGFYAGVPDSLLKDICLCIDEQVPRGMHVITANEGAAIGLAVGQHLATRKVPVVYMQNSGLGNTVNPLTSLADPDVYSIPLLLMIGWRGEPGVSDEPQHAKMGKVMLSLLDAIGVPHQILPADAAEAERVVDGALRVALKEQRPVALIVKKGVFAPYPSPALERSALAMTRERALGMVVARCGSDDITVSTTGKLSRELFELRKKEGQGHDQDFLTVGSMGHASQIALGISLSAKKRVICLDGDGALLMHMGSLAVNGQYAPKSFLHVVFNNGCHESVGGQPTVCFDIDIPNIAKACGYRQSLMVKDEAGLQKALDAVWNAAGPILLEIQVNGESRKDLGRPTRSPQENKKDLMDLLNS